jgi:hypothetical protein
MCLVLAFNESLIGGKRLWKRRQIEASRASRTGSKSESDFL